VSGARGEGIVFCQKLFHANLVEVNANCGRFLLIAKREEENPAQRAEQAQAERDSGLQKEGRGVLRRGFKVLMVPACALAASAVE